LGNEDFKKQLMRSNETKEYEGKDQKFLLGEWRNKGVEIWESGSKWIFGS